MLLQLDCNDGYVVEPCECSDARCRCTQIWSIDKGSTQALDGLVNIERHMQECWSYSMLRGALDSGTIFFVHGLYKGYCSLLVALDSADIDRLCVLPEYRRQGIAESLVQRALDYCKQNDVLTVNIEVAYDNEAAIRLYNKMRFRQVAVRKGYYGNTDARVLQLML